MKKSSYFDVHSHHMSYTDKQLKIYLKNAKALDICVFFMSVDIESYDEIKQLSIEFDNIVPCFGVHPQNAFKYKDKLSDLDKYIKNASIIGEIGLDNVWSDVKTRAFQREVFLYQLNLALEYNKPVSIHTAGAEAEIYEILKDKNCKNIFIHWYHGDLSMLKKFISLGCYFSIGPDIGISDNANKIAKTIPLNKILCETDGPDSIAWVHNEEISAEHLSPYPIIKIYDMLAEILNIEKSVLCDIVKQNVISFLNI